MSEEVTIIFVGVVQLVIGICIGLMYHYLRRDVVNTREYWRGHEEGVALGRLLYARPAVICAGCRCTPSRGSSRWRKIGDLWWCHDCSAAPDEVLGHPEPDQVLASVAAQAVREAEGRIRARVRAVLDKRRASWMAFDPRIVKEICDALDERDSEATFLCDICETIQPKSDEGPTGSDGLVWCQDCYSEGQP